MGSVTSTDVAGSLTTLVVWDKHPNSDGKPIAIHETLNRSMAVLAGACTRGMAGACLHVMSQLSKLTFIKHIVNDPGMDAS